MAPPQPGMALDSGSTVVSGPYRLDSGDAVRVTVYEQPELSNTYSVDQAGFIAMPLIGQVAARGRSTIELQSTIRNKLADMCIYTFMAESLTYRLAGMIDDKLDTLDQEARKQGAENAKAIEEYAVECSIAKVYGSECLDFCADEVVQIFGGYGYVDEKPDAASVSTA